MSSTPSRPPPPIDPHPSPLVELLTLELRASGVTPPVREYRFDRVRKWRFDLAWPESLVAVEIHGGTWSGGRHVTGGGFEKDREKMNEAALAGWIVIEVTSSQIRRGLAAMWVERALMRRSHGG